MRVLKHRKMDRPRAVNRKRHADNAERAPIHASNVMLLDPKNDKPTRTRRKIDEDGTKERIAVKSGEAIPRSR